MTTFLIVGLLAMFILGAPLFSVMLGATAIGAMLHSDNSHPFEAEFRGTIVTLYDNGATKEESTVFCTIPLFIYAGYIMAAGKTADRLVRFANALFGWVPGGLAIVTIFACAVFTVFTGASGVTIIALGGVVMPSLIKQKYPERFSLGLVAGTGSVGLLFPPALPLFIYGAVYTAHANATQSARIEAHGQSLRQIYEFDTSQFLLSGIGPGMTLIVCLSIVAVLCALIWKVPRQRFSITELGRSFLIALPELMMPILLVSLLLFGVADVPQLAGLTIVYLVTLEMGVFRDFKPITLWRIGTESLALIGTIFLVIYTSQALTNLLVTAHVPQDLVAWTTDHVHQKWVFLLALNVLLLLVGTMMDIFSAMIVVLPLVMGVADFYGVNPYHLGVIFLLNLEIGYIHPPVGINLFITAFKFQKRLGEVVLAVLPFLAAMIVALILVTYVPDITWTPPPARESPVAALAEIVHEGYQAATAVAEITTASGKVLKKSDCDTMTGTDKDNCQGLFIDVSDCRRQKDQACEDKTIADYLDATDQGSAAASVDSVTLPNGMVLHKCDCDRLDDLDKSTCTDLFDDIATARAKGGEIGAEDEKSAIDDYVDPENMGANGLGDKPKPPIPGCGGGSGAGSGSGSASAAPAAPAIDSIKLPSGKTLKKTDCAGIKDISDQSDCEDLFETTLPECKGDQKCVADALEQYVNDMGPDGLGTP